MKSSYLLLTVAFSSAVMAQQVRPMTPPRATEAVTAPLATPTQVVPAAGYRIGPEDTLLVTVWKEPTLSGPLTVRPDGMISLVLIRDVPAAKKTPEELAADLQDRLKKYIQDPLVTVVVTAALSQKVYVMGEVAHVGQVPLTPNLTVLQAISSSGGLTPYANPGKIYILRTVDGKQSKINVDYRKAIKGEGPLLPSLLAGDTIVVR